MNPIKVLNSLEKAKSFRLELIVKPFPLSKLLSRVDLKKLTKIGVKPWDKNRSEKKFIITWFLSLFMNDKVRLL